MNLFRVGIEISNQKSILHQKMPFSKHFQLKNGKFQTKIAKILYKKQGRN
jgi:hypothetical protein